MKKFTLLIFILILFFPTPSTQSVDLSISPALSRNIIHRIQEKYTPMYKKYQGVESTRHLEIKTYDSKQNTLVSTAHVELLRKDYFYKESEVKVLKYVLDGKEQKVSKYKPRSFRPGYHVFDESGDNNYDTQVLGYKTIDGHQCYEVNVIPKKATKKHYQGKLYYRVNDLKLIYSSGTLGQVSFPLTGLHMDIYFNFIDDLAVISSGVITVSADVPVFFPDRRIISQLKVVNNKPILK